jgi:hypothetical protein
MYQRYYGYLFGYRPPYCLRYVFMEAVGYEPANRGVAINNKLRVKETKSCRAGTQEARMLMKFGGNAATSSRPGM